MYILLTNNSKYPIYLLFFVLQNDHGTKVGDKGMAAQRELVFGGFGLEFGGGTDPIHALGIYSYYL